MAEEDEKQSKILAGYFKVEETAATADSETESSHDRDTHGDEKNGTESEVEPCQSSSDSSDPEATESSGNSGDQKQPSHDPAVLVFKDFGYITYNLHDPCIEKDVKKSIVKEGADAFRHQDAVLPKVPFGTKAIVRGMTQNWFMKTMDNGELVPRTWLLYSPYKEAAFCFCCVLFPCTPPNAKSAFESPEGFTKWKKVEKLKTHEENRYHRQSFLEWKEVERILRTDRVDQSLKKQILNEKERWREILRRLLDTIKLLSAQNQALRGHEERLDSANPGNFLATLKYLAKYDAVMANHLSNIRENPRCVSYISHDIQNDFISLLANRVRSQIIAEIKRAKYFGILFDSTPDVSHTEQLSEVIRYVHLDYETGDVAVREAFINFIELSKKGAAGYEETIIEALNEDDMNFLDCRAQMYDKAAVMSGHISGVQTRLRDRNTKAKFINCDNHSLNLAGVHAASVDPTIITFFGTVQCSKCTSFFLDERGDGRRWPRNLNVQ